MSQRVKNIFEQAQALSPEDREDLAELLLATVDAGADFDKAWADGAARCWDAHQLAGVQPIDALRAVDEARKALKQPG